MNPLETLPRALWTGALVVVLAPAASPAPRAAAPQDDDPRGDQEIFSVAWALAVERDSRVAFTPHTSRVALAALANPVASSLDRQAALVALGAARAPRARVTLEAWLGAGAGEITGVTGGVPGEVTGDERLAAVLGLGELGEGIGAAEDLLLDLVADEDPLLAGCALLALLRTGGPPWHELALGIANTSEHPLAAVAASLVAFVDDVSSAQPSPPAAKLLDLRFEAAKRYGTFDGQSYSIALMEQLQRDQRFLDQLVLRAVAEVDLPGVKDHLLEMLLAPGPAIRVRTAVHQMPLEVERLVEASLWEPDGEQEWRLLLDEAVALGMAELMPACMRRALGVPSLAPTAAAVLVGRQPRYGQILSDALTGADPELRERAADASGDSGYTVALRHLRRLEDDEVFRVRAASWVARLRLGDSSAGQDVREVLVDQAGAYTEEQRRVLLDAFNRGPRSGLLSAFLVDLMKDVEGVTKADLVAILVASGRAVDGTLMRTHYRKVPADSTTAHRLLRAIGVLPTREDLAFLADLFPREGDSEANLVLALALTRHGHARVEPLLKAAVWTGPFNRSVLAAGVVKEFSGLLVLMHWVLKPPPRATTQDIRRLGFAIGEWGGLKAVDQLQARMGAAAGADRPALQGALFGALGARTH